MQLDQNKHRKIMFSILQDIFQSELKSKLSFKGGTLCYFIHKLNRFSTDLDFDIVIDFINNKDLVFIRDTLKPILEKYGTIKDEYNKKHTLFFLLDYGQHSRNIKIELSKKTTRLDTYEITNFFGTDIKVMKQESIFANKLLALHRRLKSRDLFDVNFFFKNSFPIKKDIIENESKLKYNDFLIELKQEILNHYNLKNILAEIGDLITDKQKKDIKKNLINNTINHIDFELKFG